MVKAQVYIINAEKRILNSRALLDTCSTANFITEHLANQLNLERTPCNITIGALDSLTTISKYSVIATIQSRCSTYKKRLTFLVVPTISNAIPDQPIARETLELPANITLADPEFHIAAPVQLLLGAGTTLSILSIGQLKFINPNQYELYAQKTLLGWIIGGNTILSQPKIHEKSHFHNTDLQFELERFWQIEDHQLDKTKKEDEDETIAHFKKHIQRNAEGRYLVALPFNEKKSKLGLSRSTALKRLHNLEKKFQRNHELQREYDKVLQEYLDLNHMSVVRAVDDTNHFYLPHHAVIKTSSTTTKVRVVFDGSAKTTSGIALNEALMAGPTIQVDLFTLLLKFRTHTMSLLAT